LRLRCHHTFTCRVRAPAYAPPDHDGAAASGARAAAAESRTPVAAEAEAMDDVTSLAPPAPPRGAARAPGSAAEPAAGAAARGARVCSDVGVGSYTHAIVTAGGTTHGNTLAQRMSSARGCCGAGGVRSVAPVAPRVPACRDVRGAAAAVANPRSADGRRASTARLWKPSR
jgi:hypothetical protein